MDYVQRDRDRERHIDRQTFTWIDNLHHGKKTRRNRGRQYMDYVQRGSELIGEPEDNKLSYSNKRQD